MDVIRIPIPEDIAYYIQMLDFETIGYQNLIRSIILDNKYPYNIEIYDKLISEYNNKNKELLSALDIVKDNYMPEEYKTKEYEFSVIFNESYILIKKINHQCNQGC